MSSNATVADGRNMLYSERVDRMRENLLASPYEGDIERARYVTRSYKKTEGLTPAVRAAMALKETLENQSIGIDDVERLVGAKSIKKVAGPIGIERSTSANRVTAIGMRFQGQGVDALGFMDAVGTTSPGWMRELLNMPEEELREMNEEILPYWRGKDLHTIMSERWKEAGLKSGVAGAADMQGHTTFGLKKILDLGFDGIAKQAEDRLAQLDANDPATAQQGDFLEGAAIAARSVRAHAERYAELAERMAETTDEERAAELRAIAERCRRVPALAPRSFIEAVQATWMSQVVLAVSYGEDSIFAAGRVDQYLYPFYRRDLEAGAITREEALETLEEYLIKLSTFTGFGPNNLTIGGIGRNGESAVNEVSYMIVDAYTRLKGMRNGLAVRISENTPRDFLLAVCAAHRRTAGIAFYSDNRAVADLLEDGYALEDARDYGVVGCAELTSCGNNNGYTSGSSCHFELALEMALNEGRAFRTKWSQMGIATPPPREMKSFEDVKAAFRAQLSNSVQVMVDLTNVKDDVFAERFPTPLISGTIEGCLESGKDITQGGAKYNHATVSAQGIGTVVNSLAAIEWAVFDQKLVSLEELIEHTHSNFEGAEELRQQLMHKAPKYGNNDPRVDDLAHWVVSVLNEESRKHRRPIDGGTYRALLISAGSQVIGGQVLGATCDGRMARTPVSPGVGPYNGTYTEGLTAVLQSVAKISSVPLSSGTSLNLNLNPLSIQSDEGLEKFAAVIEAYFAMGGRQVQFNPFSKEMLLDAQEHPENYPDLMVKVSGYSYRYVDLSRVLQDDIIARTELEV